MWAGRGSVGSTELNITVFLLVLQKTSSTRAGDREPGGFEMSSATVILHQWPWWQVAGNCSSPSASEVLHVPHLDLLSTVFSFRRL